MLTHDAVLAIDVNLAGIVEGHRRGAPRRLGWGESTVHYREGSGKEARLPPQKKIEIFA